MASEYYKIMMLEPSHSKKSLVKLCQTSYIGLSTVMNVVQENYKV